MQVSIRFHKMRKKNVLPFDGSNSNEKKIFQSQANIIFTRCTMRNTIALFFICCSFDISRGFSIVDLSTAVVLTFQSAAHTPPLIRGIINIHEQNRIAINK